MALTRGMQSMRKAKPRRGAMVPGDLVRRITRYSTWKVLYGSVLEIVKSSQSKSSQAVSQTVISRSYPALKSSQVV